MSDNNGADNNEAMCKMSISLKAEEEMGSLQRDVRFVCEAMLAFSLGSQFTMD